MTRSPATFAPFVHDVLTVAGEGVSIILEASERLAGRRPQYTLNDDSELVLTIYGARTEPEAMG